MIQVWSCGGGVQSAAIAVLIIEGRLPKPDHAIIVDTEREKSTTWDYYTDVLRPELAKVGLNLVRVPKSQYAKVDLYPTDGKPLIPAYTRPEGRLETFCSNEWKRRVIMRYLRAQGVKFCQNWIGISTDELHRIRTGPPAWFQPRYPLIWDVPKSRGACFELVRLAGWPEPPRSSCWMCPHHDDTEWRDMTSADMEKAVKFERSLQQRDSNLYLHPSRKPLDQVDFKARVESKVDGCQTGFCFT
jgi:hypothetical protein